MKKLQIFLISLLCLLSLTLFAAPASPLILEDSSTNFSPDKNVQFLEDASRELSFEVVSSEALSSRFAVRESPNFGRSRSAFWVRFQLEDQSQQKWYLLLEAMIEDEFDLYIYPVGQVGKSSQAMTERYASKLQDHRRRAWSLNFPKNEALQVYMRLTNGDSVVSLPIEFLNADAMVARSSWAYKISSTIYAGMVILALYQLCMFLIARERNYLYLMLCTMAMALLSHRTNPAFDGLNILRETNHYFFAAPIILAGLTTAAFAREMLGTKHHASRVDFTFKLLIGIALVMIFTVGLVSGGTAYALLFALTVVVFTQIGAFYVAYFKGGGVIAKYFAWIYLVPSLLHLPNLVMLVFKIDLWQVQRDLIPAFGTLLLMLLLALLQAKRVTLMRDEILRSAATDKAKDEFIVVMNHELRTPMNAVVGLSDLLKLENLIGIQKDYVDRLSDASRHMMQLINNVLDYSQTRQTLFDLKSNPFRLDIAMQSIHQLLLQQANQKGLVLLLDNQTEKELIIEGDRSRLTQVLLNLLNNAIKYTPDGRVSLSITQQEGEADRVKLHFSVSDTGPGIPAGEQEKLFDPFTQLETKTSFSRREGIGLGLSISKKLVEHMGGLLQLSSYMGTGSEFFFDVELPRGSVTDAESTRLANMNELTELSLPPGIHILLVDDSEVSRFVAAEMLQNMGAEVSQANSGRNAILQLQQHSYDLVLLDISMDDIDGLEVSRKIRSEYGPQLPIIALTAHVFADMERQCSEAGMDAFIGKPYEYHDLFLEINQQLSHK